MIRPAEPKDASRLAEILIFGKRTSYRDIFHNDEVSFNEMQVLDLALRYRDEPDALRGVYVLDDGIVRGLFHLMPPLHGAAQLKELYVDPFFQGQGYGKALMQGFVAMAKAQGATGAFLWVLQKNQHARVFYESQGFAWNGDTMIEDGTPEVLCRYTINWEDAHMENAIKAYFRSWIDKDASVLDKVFAPSITYYESYGPVYQGLEQVKQWFGDWNKRASVQVWDIKQCAVQGQTAFVEWYFACTYDGAPVVFDGVTIARFDADGKICEIKEFQSQVEHRYPYGKA